MTFLTLQQELAAHVGLDQTTTAQATLLKRWINTAQQIIFASFQWPFARNPTSLVIQTVPDYTTGTVATTAGSTTVTFSATIAVSRTGSYLQTASSKDWYRITAHTAGTASATLEIGAINTASADTYTIRKFYYSTDATVDRVIQIRQSVVPFQLNETGLEYFQQYNPEFLSSGSPRAYMMAGQDSNNYPQFRLWPNPDSVINLYVDYLRVATDMSADADVSVIPAKWHTNVLLEGAKAQAFSFMDDTRMVDSYKLFQLGIESMREEYEEGLRRHRVMTAIDQQPSAGSLGYMPLPFNYPRGT